MDEVEALARAYCREFGSDPDAIVDGPDVGRGHGVLSTPRWQWFAEEARQQLAWSRAMEAVKRP